MNSKAPEKIEGTVFNVQRYSIHDGPGIRTTVFLKGCPLRCSWCQNPESQAFKPVLFFQIDKCTGCGTCETICPNGAVKQFGNKSKTDRKICLACGKCTEPCFQDARSIMGEVTTAGQIFNQIESDAVFYENSGGGVTISGGDPLAQPEFTCAILNLCKKAGFHTAIDTCGYAPWETFKQVLAYTDLVLFDFKHFEDARHKAYTGVSNKLILENAVKLHHDLHIPMLARIPVIPGCNDSTDHIRTAADFISKQLDTTIKVHLIPYHKMGEGKYYNLETTTPDFKSNPPEISLLERLQKIFQEYGLTALIGG